MDVTSNRRKEGKQCIYLISKRTEKSPRPRLPPEVRELLLTRKTAKCRQFPQAPSESQAFFAYWEPSQGRAWSSGQVINHGDFSGYDSREIASAGPFTAELGFY